MSYVRGLAVAARDAQAAIASADGATRRRLLQSMAEQLRAGQAAILAANADDLAQAAANGTMSVWQAYVAGLDPTDPAAVFEMDSVQSAAGVRITVGTVSNRSYRVEFLDGELAVNPQLWTGFQANGAWTNVEPYTNWHTFFDDGTATNSGWPVTSYAPKDASAMPKPQMGPISAMTVSAFRDGKRSSATAAAPSRGIR